KARRNFKEVSQHSESGTPSRRRDLGKRLGSKRIRNVSGSPEPRRGRSKSPRKRDSERKTVSKRLEKGVFHKLGDKEKKLKQNSGKDQPKTNKKEETSNKDKALAILMETDIQEKDKNKAKNDKTKHENEKSMKRSQSQSQSQVKVKVKGNTTSRTKVVKLSNLNYKDLK
ncbi:hypothetical protein Tco_1195944, partial [Tanacetum coccineum]